MGGAPFDYKGEDAVESRSGYEGENELSALAKTFRKRAQ
jgi:hypothetical protein